MIEAPEQVTLRELLKDPVYKRFFVRQPPARVIQQQPGKKTWRLFVQKKEDGKWSRAELSTYKAAFYHAKRLIQEGVHDLTINSKVCAYHPPTHRGGQVWDRFPTSHEWCPWCRRPVVYWWFSHHHALPKNLPHLAVSTRCSICGYRKDDVWIRRYLVGG